MLFFAIVARSQYNDTTLVVDGVTTNFIGFAQSGTNNFLLITNGGSVTLNTFAGSINARTNSAVISGTGSILRGNTFLTFGGTSNSLEAVDGGSIAGFLQPRGSNNFISYRNTESANDIVFDGESSLLSVVDSKLSTKIFSLRADRSLAAFIRSEFINNNVAIEEAESARMTLRAGTKASALQWEIAGNQAQLDIADPGTSITGSNMFVHGSYRGASLIVSAGAQVEIQRNLEIGRAHGFTYSPSNNVVVTGAGSIITVGGAVTVGDGGTGWNILTVTDGAALVSSNTMIGPSASNTVTLRGVGTLWTNAGGLQISGNSNRIVMLEGARLHTALLTNSDPGHHAFTNGAANNGLLFEKDAALTVSGDLLGGDHLRMMGAGEVQVGRIRWDQNFYGHQLDLADGVRLTVATNILVTTETNLIDISNGSKLATPFLAMGARSGYDTSSNNAVRVAGAGSELNVDSLSITSHFNHILVSDGAAFTSGSYSNSGGGSSSIVVNGPGSVWNHVGNLIVGSGGSNNVVRISNGAIVTNASASFGENHDNQFGTYAFAALTVEGERTRWVTRSNLAVGINASGNSMTVRDGAFASADQLAVGVFNWTPVFESRGFIAAANTVVIDGAGTRLDISGGIVFGRGSRLNQFRISGGALVTADSFHANELVEGDPTVNLTNVVEIDGAQSKLILAHAFVNVNAGGLVITNGGALQSGSLFQTSPRTEISVAVGRNFQPAVGAYSLNLDNSKLTLHVPDGFKLGADESIRLMTANTISGGFGNVKSGGRIIAANGRDSFELTIERDVVRLSNHRISMPMGLSAALTNKTIQLTFDAGAAAGVETSTNLVEWVKVDAPAFESADGKSTWSAEVQTNQPTRFYRLTR